MHNSTTIRCHHGFVPKRFLFMAAILFLFYYSLSAEQIKDSVFYFYNLGESEYYKGNYVLAQKYWEKSLEISLRDNDTITIINTYINLGIIDYWMNNYPMTSEYYAMAEKLMNPVKYSKIGKAGFYTNKALLYSDLMEYEKSIQYNRLALNLLDSIGDFHSVTRFKILNNQAVLYKKLGEIEKAIVTFKQSLKNEGKAYDKIIVYRNLGNCYQKISDYGKAEDYYKQSILMTEKAYGKNHIQMAYNYLEYARFLLDIGKTQMAKDYFQKSIKIRIANYGDNHPLVGAGYDGYAEYFEKINMPDSALYYYQKTLISFKADFNSINYSDNPQLSRDISDIDLLDPLKNKALMLKLVYDTTNHDSLLYSGLDCIDKSLDILDFLRKTYTSEKSKLLIGENEQELFSHGIDIALALYEISGKKEFLQHAYQIHEKAKGGVLLELINEAQAKNFGGIPNELLDNETNLNREISMYEEFMYEEQKNQLPDTVKLKTWNSINLDLKQEHEKLLGLFEKDYPKYYDLKYKPSEINISQIQKSLKNHQSILEYSLHEKEIHIFLIQRRSLEVKTIAIDSSFYTMLDGTISILTDNNFSSPGAKEAYKKFNDYAHKLYSALIGPLENVIKNDELIIIPDGKLAFIPYEILITEKVSFTNNDIWSVTYKRLPFLLKKYAIGYAYSGGLWLKNQETQKTTNSKMLAFAPDYGDTVETNEAFTLQQKYRSKLYPIPGAKKEVLAISRLFDGNAYLGKTATEANFKRLSKDYGLLHLAMYSIIDDDNPMYSKFVFSFPTDSSEDGLLNTYELYNLNLNAKMIVCSCNSGYGQLKDGEGVISLSRGLMYAGCPSITMSLWEVEDNASADLMYWYYKFLKRGKSKSKALQLAKLRFLEQADMLKSHPHFWSGFVVVGNSSPIMHHRYIIISISGILVLLGLFVFIRKEFLSKKKNFV